MYFWYILKKFSKNFLVISFALSFFYILIDLVAKYSKLPASSNLKVLYIYYTFLHSFFLFFSLSIVFSLLYTLFEMIKRNELVSFYSLGFSKLKLFFPFFIFSILVYAFVIGSEFSSFSYAQEKANSILEHKSYSNTLFLKWKNRVVYFEKINPIIKKAENIKIFYLKNNKVYKVLMAKEAFFKNNEWIAKKARVEKVLEDRVLSYTTSLKFLKDFKPKILTNLNAKKVANISLKDAFLALSLLGGVSKNILISVILYKIFLPLTMIAYLTILFFKSPLHMRISNVSFFMIKSLLITILIWGVYLLIYKFTRQGVLPTYVLLIPFIVLSLNAIYIIYKER